MACKKCGVDLPSDISATYLKRRLCRDCYNKYRVVVNMEDAHCRVCLGHLTPENLYPCIGYICRAFFRANQKKKGRPLGSRDRVKRKLRADLKRKIDEAASEPEYQITETMVPEIAEHPPVPPLPPRKDDLYIMQNSRIPNELKVGRSHDPVQRARDLGKSQNFRMQILKTYPACGHLEATIHKRLKSRRVTEGEGQEWFRDVGLSTIDMIVQGTIAESQIQ